ncbi:MAG: zinc ABC transporter substrate-binding protein [Planctomycetota bacterium]
MLSGSTGCKVDHKAPLATSNGQINVVATTVMVGDLVSAIGGNHVNVTVLLGPGVDPHLHKTTRDDVARIMSADAVFYSGLHLEGKMTDAFDQVGKQKPVVAVAETLEPSKLLGDEATDSADPHVWFDARLWMQTIDTVAETLAQLRPEAKPEFEQLGRRYANELLTIAEYGNNVLSTIPQSQRLLITSHDAFGYLGRTYDIEVLGVQGISTDSEAGLKRVNELVDLIVERQVPAVFIESSVSEKGVRALIDGAHSRGHNVVIGGELFSDAAGQSDTYEGTHIGMLDHNFTVIANALGGSAPEYGMADKLRLSSRDPERPTDKAPRPSPSSTSDAPRSFAPRA